MLGAPPVGAVLIRVSEFNAKPRVGERPGKAAMRRLLVTGGAGFIGANFVHYWLRRHAGDRVVVLDGLTYAGNRASLAAAESNPHFHFVQGDVRDTDAVEAVIRTEAIDTVVHFAAESHVDRSIHGPDAFITTNVLGTHTLLKAVKRLWLDEPLSGLAGAPRFHHVSTDEVYGTLMPGDPPFTETTAYAPNSPYAASKAASDHLVRAYHRTYGLPVTISNCCNNYGPYQFPEKLIPLMIINALDGKPLPIYGDGRHIRDWLYSEDHCRGIERVLIRGRVGEAYNLGGENELPNLEIVRLICRLIDEVFGTDPALAERFPVAPPSRGEKSEKLITFVADRPGHDLRYSIDPTKARTELGFRARVKFLSGLGKTLAWYLANEEWWRAVMDGRYRAWRAKHYGDDSAPAATS